VSSYKLIEAERTNFPIPLMCRMLGVFEERLLRLEGQAALQEEPRGCRPHCQDPRDPSKEQRDLRLPEDPR
jgi:hypothetical protein